MGVKIIEHDFDTVDLMKDLEIARHVLKKKSEDDNKGGEGTKQQEDTIFESESENLLLLEWDNKDNGEDNFTLVKSKKKSKKNASVTQDILRRSKRTTLSEYRNKGQQKNSEPLSPKGNKKQKSIQ